MSIMPQGGWSNAPEERQQVRTPQSEHRQGFGSSEKWIAGMLLLVAMLTFFFPLVSLQLPILGDQEISGYDLLNRGRDIDRALSSIGSRSADENSTVPARPPLGDSAARAARIPSMPLSVQYISFVAIEIILGLGCAVLALICCFGSIERGPTKTISSIGAMASIAAVLQLVIANSDMHTWLRDQIVASSSALADNPFAGVAQQIEALAVNSVQVKPGSGLYVLAATLSLTAMILFSGVMSSFSSNEIPAYPAAVETSGHRRVIGLVFLILALVAGGFVIGHYVHAPSLNEDAFAGDFRISKAFNFLFGNYDPVSKSSSTNVSDGTEQQSQRRSTLILDSSYAQNGVQKHLVVTSTIALGADCHACDTGIGAYLFVKTETGWAVAISDKEIGRFGASGNAGKAKALDFAPDIHGFTLSMEDGGQGETGVYELFAAPVDNHFRQVLSLTTESDNLGDCGSLDPDSLLGHDPCVQSKSAVHFLKSAHEGFFDIAVDDSGTANTDQGVVRTDGRKLYVFSDGKYIQQGVTGLQH